MSDTLLTGVAEAPLKTDFPRPPVVLTFLAPADRCNQRCPDCILDQVGDPVTRFDLEPAHYARFVDQFVAADVPILTISFQGYEVTLPRSWPYVEAVFATTKAHGLRRSFVTNGMLLHRWTDRIDDLDPQRVVVSVDGASAEVNDAIRGISGAFDATFESMRRFLERAPRFQTRLAVVSTVYNEDNFRSLLGMPGVLKNVGISRWIVSCGLTVRKQTAEPGHSTATLSRWFAELRRAAEAAGLDFHVSDEFGLLRAEDRARVKARRIFNLDFLYRLDPTGGIRSGGDILGRWDESRVRRWDPCTDDAVEISGYRASAKRFVKTT